MRWHKKMGLVRKLLFGTDWPIHRFYGDQKKWVDTFSDLRDADVITESDYWMIMKENMSSLLPCITKQKTATI